MKFCRAIRHSLKSVWTTSPFFTSDLRAETYSMISSWVHPKYAAISPRSQLYPEQLLSNSAVKRIASSLLSKFKACTTPSRASVTSLPPSRFNLLSCNFEAATLMNCINVFSITTINYATKLHTHICQIQTYTCILSATAHKKFALNERAVESGNNKKTLVMLFIR